MYFSFLSRQGLKAKYARITLNRFTTSFFLFSFIYCFVQGIVQSLLFSLDLEYSTLTDGIVNGGRIPPENMTFLEGSRGHLHLQMCNDVPHGQSPYPCITLFNSTNPLPDKDVRFLQGWEAGLSVMPQVNSVNITTPSHSLVLDEQCIQTLLYPSQILQNLRREDITWISLQFWLLAISFLAIINDSVPHILAVLMTRTISAAWAMYAIWRGPYFKAHFQELLAEPNTPCALDLFTEYWNKRQGYEIGDLVLSSTGLVFFSFLSWTLLRIYSAQSFKCVGAPDHIMRIHKFLMALLASLQLEIFVLVAGMGLWINILTDTAISRISAHTAIYKALYITTVILLLPWIAMGWYAIRLELKRTMIVFLAIGFVITTGWAIMFYSIVFRWSFMQWPYLGCFTVASFILLIASITLGVVCRVNFGKGLKQYLHAEETLETLHFSPDAFAHRPESVSKPKSTRTRSLSASSTRKDPKAYDDDANSPTSPPPVYFVMQDEEIAFGNEIVSSGYWQQRQYQRHQPYQQTFVALPNFKGNTGPVPF